MYRFGDGSEFKVLAGQRVCQVCLGQFEIQLGFVDDARLRMEGDYVHRIRSEDRELTQARSSCGPNELHRLLGTSITETRILSPERAEIVFSNGDALLLIDDADQYGSFILDLHDRTVVI